MKKVFMLLMAVQILSSGQFLNEVIKFNYLVRHFVEHRDHDHLGFLEFVRLHYFNESHEKSDTKNHDSLPLHHCICFPQTGFHAFLTNHQIELVAPERDKIFTPRNTDLLHLITVKAIFQPPRVS